MYLEIILSFLGGIVTAPILIEGFALYRENQLKNKYSEQMETNDQLHVSRMNDLVKQYNHAAKKYNKKLEKTEKKLARRNIQVETNENNADVVTKRIPVHLPFWTWLKQRRW